MRYTLKMSISFECEWLGVIDFRVIFKGCFMFVKWLIGIYKGWDIRIFLDNKIKVIDILED